MSLKLESKIIVNTTPSEVRIALLENDKVVELFIERRKSEAYVGRVYKGIVSRVLPGIQSAFVDIGEGKAGFLYVDDVLQESGGSGAIESVLREKQIVLVQVIKEPLNSKGPRLTMNLSFPGRYLVLSPFGRSQGISKKIIEDSERERLRSFFDSQKLETVSVIARTAAHGVSEELLKADLSELMGVWTGIEKASGSASAPQILYKDIELVERVIREKFTKSTSKVIVDDKTLFDSLSASLSQRIPEVRPILEHYNGDVSIFDLYNIEHEIDLALSRSIDLPSGGRLVIDQSEALTTFDVNSGKYVGKRKVNDTILKINLEAAEVAARQIRLRNIAGIIVIDFIDMDDPVHREVIFNSLQEKLKLDKARTNVLRVSEFGLVQMTRKRTHDSLEHLLMEDCAFCLGRGKSKTVETQAYSLFREVVRTHLKTKSKNFKIDIEQAVHDWILEEESDWLSELKTRYGLELKFEVFRAIDERHFKSGAYKVSLA